MKLVLTEAALGDLKSIRDYTLENWGSIQEERYLDRMWTKIESLLADPGKYRMRKDLFPGCRMAAQDSHVILFRVSGATLEVVCVLHGAMHYKRHLPPGGES